MDGLHGLHRHHHEGRHDHENNRNPQPADRPSALPPQRHDYRPVPAGAAGGVACFSGAPVVGLMEIPFCASSSRSFSSLFSTPPPPGPRINTYFRRPPWLLSFLHSSPGFTPPPTPRR